ncbi:hypothetical protein TBR22_A52480 [Luteitalea sp. TBR-22]|uniref:class I SAM-dependent methyltransferase n=1 Tax=Luteitalea sp. TBR-22 TaxID=2802971 RepID=UPI001AFA34B3|nr:class I SAM-dependent methyltransferase [Luteitalea sp. TBR-22]BCS36011.1 hypothetical protein TBR22_A52480 [Luteitalea sp. TBR-22]
MRVRTVETIEQLMQALGLSRVGRPPDDLDYVERHDTDAHDRKRRDALVLATLAANSDGRVLEIGTSEGRSTSNLARNVPHGQSVVTVNILPEQADPAQRHVTHLLEREAIGAFYRARGLDNIVQVHADTLRWNPDWTVDHLALAFIDGCHDRAAVHSDSRLAYSRLAPGGLIAWHDFCPELRGRFDWIDDAMSGVEDFVAEQGIDGEVLHLRHSWIGVLRRVALPAIRPARDLRVGLVVDWPRHLARRCGSSRSACVVEGLRQKFTAVLVQRQEELEAVADGLDGLVSLEPGCAAPRLDLVRTPALRAALGRIPTLLTLCDPGHDDSRHDDVREGAFDLVIACEPALSPAHRPGRELEPQHALSRRLDEIEAWLRGPAKTRRSPATPPGRIS